MRSETFAPTSISDETSWLSTTSTTLIPIREVARRLEPLQIPHEVERYFFPPKTGVSVAIHRFGLEIHEERTEPRFEELRNPIEWTEKRIEMIVNDLIRKEPEFRELGVDRCITEINGLLTQIDASRIKQLTTEEMKGRVRRVLLIKKMGMMLHGLTTGQKKDFRNAVRRRKLIR